MIESLKSTANADFRELKGGVDLNGKFQFWQSSGLLPGGAAMNTGKTLFAQLMDFLPWTAEASCFRLPIGTIFPLRVSVPVEF